MPAKAGIIPAGAMAPADTQPPLFGGDPLNRQHGAIWVLTVFGSMGGVWFTGGAWEGHGSAGLALAGELSLLVRWAFFQAIRQDFPFVVIQRGHRTQGRAHGTWDYVIKCSYTILSQSDGWRSVRSNQTVLLKVITTLQASSTAIQVTNVIVRFGSPRCYRPVPRPSSEFGSNSLDLSLDPVPMYCHNLISKIVT